MKGISKELQAAFKANIREIHARVKLNFSDITLDSSVNSSSSSAIEPDFTYQMTNGNTVTEYKWLSMDGIGDMSGEWSMQPIDTTRNDLQVGYWSDTISDIDGYITAGFIITSAPRGISSIKITGDNYRSEYPVDFDVEFTNDSGVLVGTESFTGNTLVEVDYALATALTDIIKVEVIITKWSEPLTNAKGISFTTSLTKTYSESDIELFSVLEESEISNDNSIPTGNISYSSCSLSLVNRDRQFDINNIVSPLYGNIKPNTKVDIELGAKYVVDGVSTIEYFPFFSGWTGGFDAPDASMLVTTTAYDRLNRLTTTTMTPTEVLFNQTVGDICELILNDHGLSAQYINIDSRLYESTYTIPMYFIESGTHLEELKRVSEAMSLSVYSTSDVITIDSVEALSFNVIPQEEYTRSDYTNKTNKALYDTLINNMCVPYAPFIIQPSDTVYTSSTKEPDTVDALGDTTLQFVFDQNTCVNHVLTETLPSGVTITDENYYSDRAIITFNNTATTSQEITIQIDAQYYEKDNLKEYCSSDVDSIEENGLSEFTYTENDLIQTLATADTIGDYTLATYKDPFRDVTVQLTNAGNPALELTDKITVTDRYTSKSYNIVKKDTTYDGGLSMTLGAKISALTAYDFVDNNDNYIVDNDENEFIMLLSNVDNTYELVDNNSNDIVTNAGYNLAIGGV